MMPKPCAQPIGWPRRPLNSWSAQATGPGLAASKRRNSRKATHCIFQLAGVTSHSTSQNAMISSHTTGDGSATARWRAATVQAHQPISRPPASTRPH